MRFIVTAILLFSTALSAFGTHILVPMDKTQKDHLKAYGITYWVLKHDIEASWLLNYRDGTFAYPYQEKFEKELRIRGVSYEVITDAKYNSILKEINDPEANMDVVQLLKPPKVAVYSPKTKQPWDDAVTMVLTYAEIPYDVVFDDEVIEGKLLKYDWLHLHHEDFTGQFGKFFASFRYAAWYQQQVKEAEAMAAKHGYATVSELKLAVAKKIRDFTLGGGFLFAMCSAADTYDIALAADGVDIVESMFDGDPADRNASSKLNYNNTFAFTDFQLKMNPYEYEHSTIDVNPRARGVGEEDDLFLLFEFSAKSDQVPTMLCQNHTKIIKGFMGQATAFNKRYIKTNVTIMGENRSLNEARYIHGEAGKGMWTFYGGHDPEDYQHMVGEPPTDLALHPNSPGYRLILNNVLFPSAKKKKQKT